MDSTRSLFDQFIIQRDLSAFRDEPHHIPIEPAYHIYIYMNMMVCEPVADATYGSVAMFSTSFAHFKFCF